MVPKWLIHTANISYTLQIGKLSFNDNDLMVLVNVKILGSDSEGLG